ncbi:hypothetical protein B0H16DRAFT_1463228 [Mycena metata]|uniref:Tudor domain-containing protein n=1 Tax=Mycena metata TaxID=1033252 RepID=A0AAD7IM11_9AGAR|nr:hypothetical protein B0H16DRAFT_1463228 [Mycena metata]
MSIKQAIDTIVIWIFPDVDRHFIQLPRWEPEESFLTTCALRVFWNTANCHRDHNQISKFKKGEVIGLKKAHTTAKPRRKPGPGRSSVSLIGARFFALWVPDGYYYSAYVQEGVGDKYVVRFEDDNVEATLPLKHLRDCTKLEPGDTITLLRDNAVVADLADDGSRGITLNESGEIGSRGTRIFFVGGIEWLLDGCLGMRACCDYV